MGLLDEAIREHLALRRRHGADPDEVAREELDALAPVPREEESQRQELAAEIPSIEEAPRMPFDGEHPGSRALDARDASRPLPASTMQETAEIDMRAVFGGTELDDATSWASIDRGSRVEKVAPAAASAPRSRFTAEIDGDPPGWEIPAPRVRRVERRPARGRAPGGGEWSAEPSAP